MAAFPDTCRCTEDIDNGAGLSWDVSLAANETATRSSLITFSPTGAVPLSTTKTVNHSTATPGSTVTWSYLGGTRGLKIMRHTLYVFWIGQPVGWILFAIAGWLVIAQSAGVSSFAYTLSWVVACGLAAWAWERESRGFDTMPRGEGIPEEQTGHLLRFGMLRTPATLFAQLLFWIDTFVLAAIKPGQVGVYGATVRTGQSLLLFLTSLSLVFSPFVADLHHRGERDKLDALYKNVTRWGLATTLPILLALAILPGTIMRVYGDEFVAGKAALQILIIGLIVPVIVGTVGFILIMVGRTGWDLLVYMGSFVTAVGIAVVLAPHIGMKGTAIAEAVTLTASAIARTVGKAHSRSPYLPGKVTSTGAPITPLRPSAPPRPPPPPPGWPCARPTPASAPPLPP